MLKKNGARSAAMKAWNVVNLALLWARKGGLFRGRLLTDLRAVSWVRRSIGQPTDRDLLVYGERELSFEKTPVVRVRMHRPRVGFPCINPPATDFDYDFDGDSPDCHEGVANTAGEEGEEWVDARAEEFIARFYAQMRLQRQISYLEYATEVSTETRT